MKRSPEQEAARKKRQAETRAMPKCKCGNVVKKGTTQCGRCAEESVLRDVGENATEQAKALISEVYEELTSADPDYSWIAKKMTRDRNIRILHQALNGG